MCDDDFNWATPITLAAANRAAIEWKYFRESVYWDDERPLGDLINEFVNLFGEGVRGVQGCSNFDDKTITLMAMIGIEQTGTFTFEEIEAALGLGPPRAHNC